MNERSTPHGVTGISSMATRSLLAGLTREYGRVGSRQVAIESVGGVDAARRVASGEAFDVVILAADAIARLEAASHVVHGTRVSLARSGVAAAVAAGARRPDISTEAALRAAVRDARSIGYSTGPSGVHLLRQFERWELADEVRHKAVQAPPGVAVGALVASGEVDLGFQQLSELMCVPGIDVIGPLPDAIQIVTIFVAAVCTTCTQPLHAKEFLSFLASPQNDAAKRAHGMEPA